MKRMVVSLSIGACLLLPPSLVFAGQPGTSAGVNCGSGLATATPGNAAASPGAPFNEPSATSSGGKAGKVYAGSGANTGTPANGAAVSQYDVACLQVTTHTMQMP